jgi:GMP synthase (glutamine-hydrolysing)
VPHDSTLNPRNDTSPAQPLPRVLVLRTGQAAGRVHATCGPFYTMFQRGLNASGSVRVAVDELDITCRLEGDPPPALRRYHGVIVTGSPAYVGDDEPWMRYGADLLRRIVDDNMPLLGVCFGHQLLGVAYGADVGPNTRGREMGTIEVARAGAAQDGSDALLGAGPARFAAQVTHRDVIRDPGPHLKVLATADHDACHAVQAGPRQWGLQFHPEFDDVVMRLYLEVRREVLDSELGHGACDRRIDAVRPTPDAQGVLRRFAALCMEGAAVDDNMGPSRG